MSPTAPEAAAADPPAPGRSGPLHYRDGPAVFAAAPAAACEVLYVVGGLYGNAPALAQVLALFEQEPGTEPGSKRLVFNGDFHGFDTDPATFASVQRTVLRFDALRGSVETELAGADSADSADAPDGADVGCGCDYPDWVGDGRALAPMGLNNGATGMPNCRGDAAGLVTRMATRPFAGDPARRRFGLRAGAAHIDALAVDSVTEAWRAQFLAQWPAGSDVHASTWQRLCEGPDHQVAQALAVSPDAG